VDNKTILFAAGGTGGHINPALAVAGLIRYLHPQANIHFVGTADRMETQLVPAAGYAFHTIEISGFQRSFSPQNIKRNLLTVKRLLTVGGQVNRLLNELKPDIVVGFGGYVAGPVLRGAAKRGIATAIHEQNAYPGVTNKMLAKLVDKVMLASEEAGSRMQCKHPPVTVGLPLRRELLQADRTMSRNELKLDSRPMVLSMGGSQGARAINENVVGMLGLLAKQGRAHFHHAYGQYGKWVPEALRKTSVSANCAELTLREYIDDMPRCMAAADLVIARAGAATLAELQACGVPSILIPSPNVTENHQYHNAMTMVQRGAAVLIEEKDPTPLHLAQTVTKLIGDPIKLTNMSKAARAMAVTDAAERIYMELCSFFEKKEPKKL